MWFKGMIFRLFLLVKANGKIGECLFTLTRSMITQVNIDIGPRMNAMDNIMTSILRDYVRMNPPVFFVS